MEVTRVRFIRARVHFFEPDRQNFRIKVSLR